MKSMRWSRREVCVSGENGFEFSSMREENFIIGVENDLLARAVHELIERLAVI